MQDWLLYNITFGNKVSNQVHSCHMSSLVAVVIAMYSTSIEESATINCFQLCQESIQDESS
jgi:hypothetical protein